VPRVERNYALFRALIRSVALALALSSGFALPARADDLAEFEAARTLYDRQAYAGAVDALRALVGTDPPRVSDPLLVIESRKYLAASLLFLGASEDAKTQFRLLLAQEPRYTLDPLAFPNDVLALFEQVKTDIQRELDKKRQADESARRSAEERARDAERIRRENLARLRVLAEETESVVENSRWVATIPFGVGQFQNGHNGFGVALAMGQGLSAATSTLSFVFHQRLADDRPSPADVEDAQQRESRWRTTNYVSFGVFVGLVLIGIVDAHVRFVPDRVTSRPRQLPRDLDRWVREQELSSGVPVLRF
jgi:hypothetical protein